MFSEVEWEQIRSEAERAKISLGNSPRTIVLLNFEVDGLGLRSFELLLDRETFQQLTAPINRRVEECIHRALEIACTEPGDMNYVLLAGQGSKIFAVREIIERLFTRIPLIEKYQENAVALGLCVYTGVLRGMVKDLLLSDTNYLPIRIKCLESGEEADFAVSGIHAENIQSFDLLPSYSSVPRRKDFTVKLVRPVSDRVTLELTEASTVNGIEDAIIGHIPITVDHDSDTIRITLDVDADRTSILSVINQATNTKEDYQLNNYYLDRGYRAKHIVRLL